MFSSWKTPTSSKRQLELQWINIVNSCHDQICHCDNPTFHLLYCLNKFSAFQKPEEEIRNIQCLLTGPTTTTEPAGETLEDAGILEGELENLFAEDTGEEKENIQENSR